MSPEQSEQMEKGQQVAQAGAQAAASVPPEQAPDAARDAMRSERDRIGFSELTDEDIDKFAAALSPKLIEGFRAQGAFDPPPEPVQAPANAAPPPPGDEGAAAAAEPAPAPQKRTFAHRFMGIGG
jgi:hypothetical protein